MEYYSAIKKYIYWCRLQDEPWKYHAKWKIPWTEEPGRLQSMGSLRVGHDWATSLSLFSFMHWRRKWQPTPVLSPGKSHWWRSLVGCSPWGHKESDTTKWLHFHFHFQTFTMEFWIQFLTCLRSTGDLSVEGDGVLIIYSLRWGHCWWLLMLLLGRLVWKATVSIYK